MKPANELKELLDRLKSEVNYDPAPVPPAAAVPVPRPATERPITVVSKAERFVPPPPLERSRPVKSSAPAGVNLIWSENKETMLFGTLASLVVILGGILAALDYLILIGAVVFMLFSFMMFAALLGYCLNFRGKTSAEGDLSVRLERLSAKVEALASRGGPAQAGMGDLSGGGRDLEQKVEELRTLVKSLARAVGAPPGDKS